MRAPSYFAIINLEEAHVDAQILISKPPVVEIGENILGWNMKHY